MASFHHKHSIRLSTIQLHCPTLLLSVAGSCHPLNIDVASLQPSLPPPSPSSLPQGRAVSFRNAIIIMTSNLGSSEIYREAAAAHRKDAKPSVPKPGQKGMKELVMDEVRLCVRTRARGKCKDAKPWVSHPGQRGIELVMNEMSGRGGGAQGL